MDLKLIFLVSIFKNRLHTVDIINSHFVSELNNENPVTGRNMHIDYIFFPDVVIWEIELVNLFFYI